MRWSLGNLNGLGLGFQSGGKVVGQRITMIPVAVDVDQGTRGS